MSASKTENVHPHTPKQFILFTLVAAVVASLAAWSSEALMLEVWVMFAGFISWFTRPASWRDGVCAMICLWLGIVLGAIAFVAKGALTPSVGALALPLVVFFVASLIVALRTTSIVNNMLAWFIGVVTFFAAKLGLSLEAFAHLASATALGGFAGWSCVQINRRWVEV